MSTTRRLQELLAAAAREVPDAVAGHVLIAWEDAGARQEGPIPPRPPWLDALFLVDPEEGPDAYPDFLNDLGSWSLNMPQEELDRRLGRSRGQA